MATEVHSSNFVEDGIIHGAARALFVQAYASYCEDRGPDDDLPTAAERFDLAVPGSGEDWMHYAPEDTPGYAYALAGQLISALETANPDAATGIFTLASRAAKADGVEEINYQDFGHYLAMQWIGHGVGWFDSHARFDMEIPSRPGCSWCEFDPEAFGGE